MTLATRTTYQAALAGALLAVLGMLVGVLGGVCFQPIEVAKT